MDEFLGCSDKVRPKFVKQTQLLENKKNGESENLDKEFRSRGKLRDICFTLGNRFSRVIAGTTGNLNPSVMFHGKIYHGKSHLPWCV